MPASLGQGRQEKNSPSLGCLGRASGKIPIATASSLLPTPPTPLQHCREARPPASPSLLPGSLLPLRKTTPGRCCSQGLFGTVNYGGGLNRGGQTVYQPNEFKLWFQESRQAISCPCTRPMFIAAIYLSSCFPGSVVGALE